MSESKLDYILDKIALTKQGREITKALFKDLMIKTYEEDYPTFKKNVDEL